MSAPSANTFGAQKSTGVRKMMSFRTIEHDAAFLLPTLDALPPAFVFADFGCGPGAIALSVARRYPQATVLGFDIDPISVGIAQQEAAAQNLSSRVRFTTGNVLDAREAAATPGFERLNGQCDVAFENMTLMHTKDPAQVVKSMRAAVRTGGVVACRDQDPEMNCIYPMSPGLDLYLRVQPRAIAMNGCDLLAARKLLEFALGAGFKRGDIAVTGGNFHYSNADTRRQWADFVIDFAKNKDIEKMVHGTGLTEWQGEAVAKDWDEWAGKDEAWYWLLTMEVLCQKTE